MKSKPDRKVPRDEWKTACIGKGINGNRFSQTIKPLIEQGDIRQEGNKYTIDLPFD